MLSILKKRLCPLMGLALAFGCGKKISDPSTTGGNGSTQGQAQELPANLTLQLTEAFSPFKSYQLPLNAWFKLPTMLSVKEGNAIGKRVKIYYNLLTSGDYEFHCYYSSTRLSLELSFEKCESSQGVEILSNAEELEGADFPMDKGTTVKMKLTNPTGTNLVIESTYKVDWK